MPNIYDKAQEMKSVLRESEEFQSLLSLHAKINEDEVSKKMLDNFRTIQLQLQQKQMEGQEITEEEVKKAQQQFELVQQHETISKLMEAEQRLSVVIGDINRIITEPLEELYGKAE